MTLMSKKLVDIANVRGFPKYKTFGYAVEIEAEFNRPLGSGDGVGNFLVHNDGSLRGYGYEFVSPGPRAFEDLEADITELLSTKFFTGEYVFSNRTSTHVHMNVQNLTLEELFKILLVYYMCEVALTHEAGLQREGNLFCLRLFEAERLVTGLKDMIDGKFDKVLRDFDQYKYSALNFANVPKIGSIEFRQFRGTNHTKDVLKWLRRIDTMVKKALTFKDFRDIITTIDQNPSRFITSVLGPDIAPFEIYNVDHNYSILYELWDYLETAEERRQAQQKTKVLTKSKSEYVFNPIADELER
jgi:hypothetical protein